MLEIRMEYHYLSEHSSNADIAQSEQRKLEIHCLHQKIGAINDHNI